MIQDRHPDGAVQQRLVRRWADAVAETSFVGCEPAQLRDCLRGLVERLAYACADTQDPEPTGHQIGADMVAAHMTAPATLARTLVVLTEALAGLYSPAIAPQRVSRLVAAVAEGYAAALRDRAIDEQEDIRRAAVEAFELSEQRRLAGETRFQTMFSAAAIGIGIGIGDLAGNIQQVNPALIRLFGYPADEFTRRNVADMIHPDDAPAIWQSYQELVSGRRDHFRVEKRFFRADGEVIWTQLSVSLVRDAHGAPAYQIAMLQDVTEQQQLRHSLEHMAYHDPLTGLANRARVCQRLTELFAPPVDDRRVGICVLDLDGFKTINDTLGHDCGDQLLTAVARRLDGCRGPDRLVARMGGDEFVVLWSNTTGIEQVETLAQQILAELGTPLQVGAHQVWVTTSIGVLERPVATSSAAQLLTDADLALYWAKTDGKARYAVFHPQRRRHEATTRMLAATLPAATARHEFYLDYQPLVSLTDGHIRGVEALLRWRHPTLGVLPPSRFIPLAEQTGAIVALGQWALHTACRQARHWHTVFGEHAPFVSVNLAPRQLQEPGFAAAVDTALTTTDLPPDRLQLEITEQALMSDLPGPRQTLHTLASRGVRLALDDFGAGYSNLTYLRTLPVHELKLDRSFVTGLAHPDTVNRTDEQILSFVINMAHAL